MIDQIPLDLHGEVIKLNTTQLIFLGFCRDADHARILNIRRRVSVILNNILGVYVCCKVQIQPAIASDSTDGEIRCMQKAVNKTKIVRRYMEDLALHNGTLIVQWEDNTSCIYVVEDKIVTPIVKHIYIPVFFLI